MPIPARASWLFGWVAMIAAGAGLLRAAFAVTQVPAPWWTQALSLGAWVFLVTGLVGLFATVTPAYRWLSRSRKKRGTRRSFWPPARRRARKKQARAEAELDALVAVRRAGRELDTAIGHVWSGSDPYDAEVDGVTPTPKELRLIALQNLAAFQDSIECLPIQRQDHLEWACAQIQEMLASEARPAQYWDAIKYLRDWLLESSRYLAGRGRS